MATTAPTAAPTFRTTEFNEHRPIIAWYSAGITEVTVICDSLADLSPTTTAYPTDADAQASYETLLLQTTANLLGITTAEMINPVVASSTNIVNNIKFGVAITNTCEMETVDSCNPTTLEAQMTDAHDSLDRQFTAAFADDVFNAAVKQTVGEYVVVSRPFLGVNGV